MRRSARMLSRAASWLEREQGGSLSFSCTECGRCCKGRTQVFVNLSEAQILAEYTGRSLEQFIAQDTETIETPEGLRVSLRTKVNNDNEKRCLFLDASNKCSVYEARPTQCRTYPFWPQNIMGEAEWTRESHRCEGISVSSSANRVPSATIMRNLIIHQVHNRGGGSTNLKYEDAVEVLEDSIRLEGEEMVDNFSDEFFALHHSRILYEDKGLRIVDTTLPESVINNDSDVKFNSTGESDNSVPLEQATYRRLEFIDAPSFSQSEVKLKSNGEIDHSLLSMSVHRFMASAVLNTFSSFSLKTKCQLLSSSSLSKQTPFRVLLLGAGCCTLPMHLMNSSLVKESKETIDQSFQILAVETKAEILDLARCYFGAEFVSHDIPSSVENLASVQETRDHGVIPIAISGEDFISATNKHVGYDVVIVDAAESKNLYPTSSNKKTLFAPPPSLVADIPALFNNVGKCSKKFEEESGGLLVMNILGGQHWVNEVHERCKSIVSSDPRFDGPVMLRIGANHVLVIRRRGNKYICESDVDGVGSMKDLGEMVREIISTPFY